MSDIKLYSLTGHGVREFHAEVAALEKSPWIDASYTEDHGAQVGRFDQHEPTSPLEEITTDTRKAERENVGAPDELTLKVAGRLAQ